MARCAQKIKDSKGNRQDEPSCHLERHVTAQRRRRAQDRLRRSKPPRERRKAQQDTERMRQMSCQFMGRFGQGRVRSQGHGGFALRPMVPEVRRRANPGRLRQRSMVERLA